VAPLFAAGEFSDYLSQLHNGRLPLPFGMRPSRATLRSRRSSSDRLQNLERWRRSPHGWHDVLTGLPTAACLKIA